MWHSETRAIRHKENMKEYLDLVKGDAEFDTVILSLTMEDGLAVSYRHKALASLI